MALAVPSIWNFVLLIPTFQRTRAKVATLSMLAPPNRTQQTHLPNSTHPTHPTPPNPSKPLATRTPCPPLQYAPGATSQAAGLETEWAKESFADLRDQVRVRAPRISLNGEQTTMLCVLLNGEQTAMLCILNCVKKSIQYIR